MTQLTGFKFMITIVLMFKKIESEDKVWRFLFKLKNRLSMKLTLMICFSQSLLQLYQTQKSLRKRLGRIIDSVIDHTISISKYNPLAGSSCIKLSKELDHQWKGLINIQNIDDNQCYKWCLFRCLNPADHHPAKITKAD